MNTQPNNDGTAAQLDALHRHLAGLPEPQPAPALWPRIERTRRRRQLGRRVATVCGAGVLVLGSVMALRMPTRDPGAFVTAAPSAPTHFSANLRAIDHQLQAAYDGAADAEQIKSLWRAREHAANSLDARSIDHDHIIRL